MTRASQGGGHNIDGRGTHSCQVARQSHECGRTRCPQALGTIVHASDLLLRIRRLQAPPVESREPQHEHCSIWKNLCKGRLTIDISSQEGTNRIPTRTQCGNKRIASVRLCWDSNGFRCQTRRWAYADWNLHLVHLANTNAVPTHSLEVPS